MPNVMVSSTCNLHCDYCFAQSAFSSFTPFISIPTFEKICRFIVSGDRHIGLIGGEPTLHPEFEKIVASALRYTEPENIILFTNGLFTDKYIETLKKSKIRIMINCNGESILKKQKQKFLDNIDLCHRELNWDKSISLSFNLHRTDQDIHEFLDLLDRYPVGTIRFAIASPSSVYQGMLPSDYFQMMEQKAVEFFSAVNRRRIKIVMDCNIIPNCMQNEIISAVSSPFVSGFPKSVCRPVLDFCIDETVVRCFGLSDFRVDMNRFSSLSQLYSFFVNAFDSMAYHKPSELKCKECFERKCMGCMNGCLSFSAHRAIFLD